MDSELRWGLIALLAVVFGLAVSAARDAAMVEDPVFPPPPSPASPRRTLAVLMIRRAMDDGDPALAEDIDEAMNIKWESPLQCWQETGYCPPLVPHQNGRRD